MLQRLATLLGALSTRLGTRHHMLVIRIFLTRGGTLLAALCAAFQHGFGQWTIAGAERSARLAAFGTIGAQLRGQLMFFLPIRQQL